MTNSPCAPSTPGTGPARYMRIDIYTLRRIFIPMNIDPEALFRSLADPTRLRCLVLLHEHGELCVCELTHALKEPQPKISRHLAQLRRAGLVEDRREGLWIHYRLYPGLPDWMAAVLAQTAAGLNTQSPYRGDRERLATMASRPPARCVV